MPNRILRDWTDSDRVDGLTVHAERFFTRLIMAVDDYGRYSADPRLLKARMFPLRLEQTKEADIVKWLNECWTSGLVLLYEVSGKKYLQIEEFGQRLRIKREKYPCPPNDGHAADKRPRETETETETKPKPEVERKAAAPPSTKTLEEKKVDLEKRAQEFKLSLYPFVGNYPKETVKAFYEYWSEGNASFTKMKFELQPTWETAKRLATWARREKPINHDKHNQVSKGRPDTGNIRARAREILKDAASNQDPGGGD